MELSEEDKDLFEQVAKFLSGKIRQKNKKEEEHKARVNYLIGKFGFEFFKRYLMKKIREMGTAGPRFMYKARLNEMGELMDLNRKYRERLVHPLIYDLVDEIPDINFAFFVGANVPEDRLLPFDHFQDVPQRGEQCTDEEDESEFVVVKKEKEEEEEKKEEEQNGEDDEYGPQSMSISEDQEWEQNEEDEDYCEESDEYSSPAPTKRRKVNHDDSFIDDEE